MGPGASPKPFFPPCSSDLEITCTSCHSPLSFQPWAPVGSQPFLCHWTGCCLTTSTRKLKGEAWPLPFPTSYCSGSEALGPTKRDPSTPDWSPTSSTATPSRGLLTNGLPSHLARGTSLLTSSLACPLWEGVQEKKALPS